jgi:hypothetical protein
VDWLHQRPSPSPNSLADQAGLSRNETL